MIDIKRHIFLVVNLDIFIEIYYVANFSYSPYVRILQSTFSVLAVVVVVVVVIVGRD